MRLDRTVLVVEKLASARRLKSRTLGNRLSERSGLGVTGKDPAQRATASKRSALGKNRRSNRKAGPRRRREGENALLRLLGTDTGLGDKGTKP